MHVATSKDNDVFNFFLLTCNFSALTIQINYNIVNIIYKYIFNCILLQAIL